MTGDWSVSAGEGHFSAVWMGLGTPLRMRAGAPGRGGQRGKLVLAGFRGRKTTRLQVVELQWVAGCGRGRGFRAGGVPGAQVL